MLHLYQNQSQFLKLDTCGGRKDTFSCTQPYYFFKILGVLFFGILWWNLMESSARMFGIWFNSELSTVSILNVCLNSPIIHFIILHRQSNGNRKNWKRCAKDLTKLYKNSVVLFSQLLTDFVLVYDLLVRPKRECICTSMKQFLLLDTKSKFFLDFIDRTQRAILIDGLICRYWLFGERTVEKNEIPEKGWFPKSCVVPISDYSNQGYVPKAKKDLWRNLFA